MSWLGWVLVAGILLFVFGIGLAFIAGGLAVHRYPDPSDGRRNARAYTAPAAAGIIAAIVGAVIAFVAVVWAAVDMFGRLTL